MNNLMRIAVSKAMMRRPPSSSSLRVLTAAVNNNNDLQTMLQQQQQKRRFAVEAIQPSENQVKEAIKKMMLDRQHNILEVLHPIEDEELDQSFQQFQNILHEAELCIADLKEAGDEFDEELKCAEGSVELAFNACVDLLDDLRRADDDQLQRYSDERHENALRLKQLRQAMDEIVQNHNR